MIGDLSLHQLRLLIVCSRQTIVCRDQTMVCREHTIVCCRQTKTPSYFEAHFPTARSAFQRRRRAVDGRWPRASCFALSPPCHPQLKVRQKAERRRTSGRQNQRRLVYFKPRLLFLVKKERQGRPERNNLIIFAHQEQKKAISSVYRQ